MSKIKDTLREDLSKYVITSANSSGGWGVRKEVAEKIVTYVHRASLFLTNFIVSPCIFQFNNV